MATTKAVILPSGTPVRASGPGSSIWREDLIASLLSGMVIAGLLLDGWNHLVLQKGKLGSFFTPWHGLLYAGFTANAIWVISRNKHLWNKNVKPDPHFYRLGRLLLRYPFAMEGLVLVWFGMSGDLVWHTLLGEETDVARVIAPFHILLFLGASLLIAAPLRSAWHAPSVYPWCSSFVRLLPPIISVTLLSLAGSFLLQWISPFVVWDASSIGSAAGIVPGASRGLQTAMASRIVLANILLVGPALLAMRRWFLPTGTMTVMFTFVATCMAALTSFHLGWTILAAAAGGAATDAALHVFRNRSAHTQMFVVAGVAPLVCWPVYFVILAAAYRTHWPVDFYLGISFLCGLIGFVVAFLAGLPVPPEADSVRCVRTPVWR